MVCTICLLTTLAEDFLPPAVPMNHLDAEFACLQGSKPTHMLLRKQPGNKLSTKYEPLELDKQHTCAAPQIKDPRYDRAY